MQQLHYRRCSTKRMDMSVPKVELVPFNEISDIMGDEDQTVVGIMLGFEGDVYGMMMFLFDTKSAHHLVNSLMFQNDAEVRRRC